jgi:hypothetical protein
MISEAAHRRCRYPCGRGWHYLRAEAHLLVQPLQASPIAFSHAQNNRLVRPIFRTLGAPSPLKGPCDAFHMEGGSASHNGEYGIECNRRSRQERSAKMKQPSSTKRFDQLLQVMITQPVPSEKPAKEALTSRAAASSSYGDTRTRAGKAASASSKPKRKSR